MAVTESRGKIEGRHYLTGEGVRVEMEDGLISEIETGGGPVADDAPWVGPGLVDLQVNGYAGFDFNSAALDEEHIRGATHALWREGVTTYLPTVITNTDEAIERALRTIAAACARDDQLGRTIAGLHLEGPFISPEDGPRGAHDKTNVKAPDWGLFERWQEAAEGRIALATVSPEWPTAPEFIERCVEGGVIVSIGHTAATPEQVREAVAAGASMSTHLGNGAHPSLPRHPNYIWEQLAQDALWACVIADGFHLPDSVLKVILKVKGRKALLVSDAVSFAGMEPGEYQAAVGGRVILSPEGRLSLAESPGLLAGSVRPLRDGVEKLVRAGLLDLGEAWETASVRPASALGLTQAAGLAVGAPADVVEFACSRGTIEVLRTHKAGQPAYDARKP